LEKGELTMAKRICFISTPSEYPIYKEIEVEFEYFNGFAVSQKQKSIRSMHESVNRMNKSLQILEVSTKSTNPTGVALSAFNLKFYEIKTDREYPLENIFCQRRLDLTQKRRGEMTQNFSTADQPTAGMSAGGVSMTPDFLRSLSL
jgi:hypothetical protein